MKRFLSHDVATPWLVFGLFEASIIAAGCSAALFYVYRDTGPSPGGVFAFACLLSLGAVLLMHTGGLYTGEAVLDSKRTLWRTGVLCLPIFALAIWTTGALAKHTDVPIYPNRWQWTGALTAAWLLLALFLRTLLREIYRSGALTLRVVIVGSAERAAQISRLARESHRRFAVVGHFDPARENGIPHLEISDLVTRTKASEVVFSVGSQSVPWSSLIHCRLAGIRVTDYLDFCERETRRLRIDDLRDDWLLLSPGFSRSAFRDRMRRLLEIAFALVGFVATAPVLLLTALAIKLEDGGPILYRQERVGLLGQSFTLLKFRSMREDAEADGPTWAAEDDGRITFVGQIIRKVRIDELPQFWNVLKGQMSIVGPRPERPHFVSQFSRTVPFYDYRHAVRPGITGWAQVSFRYGASLEDTRRKLSYDLYYIKNRGLLLDLLILLRTMGVVLRGEGAR